MTYPSGHVSAWVSYDASSGTSCVIGAAYNVSSVTHDGTGLATVNFASALPSAEYVVAGTARQSNVSTTRYGVVSLKRQTTTARSTTTCAIKVIIHNGSTLIDGDVATNLLHFIGDHA